MLLYGLSDVIDEGATDEGITVTVKLQVVVLPAKSVAV
jgi:hypothetical protein